MQNVHRKANRPQQKQRWGGIQGWELRVQDESPFTRAMWEELAVLENPGMCPIGSMSIKLLPGPDSQSPSHNDTRHFLPSLCSPSLNSCSPPLAGSDTSACNQERETAHSTMSRPMSMVSKAGPSCRKGEDLTVVHVQHLDYCRWLATGTVESKSVHIWKWPEDFVLPKRDQWSNRTRGRERTRAVGQVQRDKGKLWPWVCPVSPTKTTYLKNWSHCIISVSEKVMEISHSGCKFIKSFYFNQFLLSVFWSCIVRNRIGSIWIIWSLSIWTFFFYYLEFYFV